MLRAVAVMTIFALSALFGVRCAGRLRLRRDLLAEFTEAVKTLQVGVEHTARPVSELLRCCGGRLTEPLFAAMAASLTHGEGAGEAFATALASERRVAAGMEAGDVQTLGQYFSMLGATSRASGREGAKLPLYELSKRLAGAEEAYRKKGRMFRTMGVLTGACAAILLL